MVYPIDTIKFEWTDPVRQRVIPVKVYFPKTNDAIPVIIFSHGLGGSRDGYGYLGRYWAGRGYAVFHLQHLGSDLKIFQEASSEEVQTVMRRAAAIPGSGAERVMDVRFAIDQLAQFNQAPGPLRGRLDLKRIGVGGHSFGANTSLAIAGQSFVNVRGVRVWAPDPRVRAVVAMCSPVPRDTNIWKEAFGSIRIPALHLTGTEDISPVGQTNAQNRRVPFDLTEKPDSYLIDYKGGDHMVFAGRHRSDRGELDATIQRLTERATTAFWDAYLRESGSAKEWLVEGGFAKELGSNGVLEIKIENRKE